MKLKAQCIKMYLKLNAGDILSPDPLEKIFF